jgi:hypothetical protein
MNTVLKVLTMFRERGGGYSLIFSSTSSKESREQSNRTMSPKVSQSRQTNPKPGGKGALNYAPIDGTLDSITGL